jgi:hypothetical protein
MPRTLIAFILTLISGCVVTPMEWVKPGMAPSEAALERQQCQYSASREALNYRAFGRSPFDRGYRYDPFTGRRLSSSSMLFSRDDPFLESRLADFCMRSKGYSLTPKRSGEALLLDP